jgi:superoxide reductase
LERVGDLFQSSDWRKEKHVPAIECPDKVGSEEIFQVKVSLGKEIAHPNTTEHHIRWIQLFFKPSGEKFTYQVGNFEFTAHGESTEGADKGPVYTNHSVTTELKIDAPGTLFATAYCNIHGLWENSKTIELK